MKIRQSDAALFGGVAALVVAHWLLRGNTSWWAGIPFAFILGICMSVARFEGYRNGRRSVR